MLNEACRIGRRFIRELKKLNKENQTPKTKHQVLNRRM